MNDSHGSRFGTCVLDVLSVWFLIWVLKLIANVFLEILFLFNFPVERSMDVQNSFIRVLVSCLFALGVSAADLILVWIVEGPCSETFATTRIWVDRCWDAMDERLLKPLHEFTEATRELKRAEEGSESSGCWSVILQNSMANHREKYFFIKKFGGPSKAIYRWIHRANL